MYELRQEAWGSVRNRGVEVVLNREDIVRENIRAPGGTLENSHI